MVAMEESKEMFWGKDKKTYFDFYERICDDETLHYIYIYIYIVRLFGLMTYQPLSSI